MPLLLQFTESDRKQLAAEIAAELIQCGTSFTCTANRLMEQDESERVLGLSWKVIVSRYKMGQLLGVHVGGTTRIYADQEKARRDRAETALLTEQLEKLKIDNERERRKLDKAA